MATYTENYNLEKPAQSDLYNIDVFNENADKVDEALGDKAENQSLAPIESSATASRNYSVGQQFVYNGLLYEATSAIASGGTITPGSNCARTTVAEELSALNDSLTNSKSFVPTGSGISGYTANRCRYIKIGHVLFIAFNIVMASSATNGAQAMKYSDFGLTGTVLDDIQFAICDAAPSIAKLVFKVDDANGGIIVEQLYGSYPAGGTVRGTAFIIMKQ